jgi:endonuclease/exonuclease/phosphatase family metal-dependent hydrolase
LATFWLLPAETLRVISFNVRYPAKDDGPDLWDLRKDRLIEVIRRSRPDLMGTQELFHIQGQYIVEKLPEYAWFGVSRRGNQEDEHMGVFYRRNRLRVIESGNFWLSETPEKPGSSSWDMSLPRMVTWGLFETADRAHRFYYYNTHFAHRRQDETARLASARLIAERIRLLPRDTFFLMTGDFNAPAGGAVYEVFASTLVDAWTKAARRTGPEGTFHGFSGKPGNARIDWILFRGTARVTEAETITWNDNGRYPSDHFPVLAVLELTAAGSPPSGNPK